MTGIAILTIPSQITSIANNLGGKLSLATDDHKQNLGTRIAAVQDPFHWMAIINKLQKVVFIPNTTF